MGRDPVALLRRSKTAVGKWTLATYCASDTEKSTSLSAAWPSTFLECPTSASDGAMTSRQSCFTTRFTPREHFVLLLYNRNYRPWH